MEAREFVADDVIYSYDLVNEADASDLFDHIERLEARDNHTVIFICGTTTLFRLGTATIQASALEKWKR